jgi:hypothetical protein
MPSPPRPNYPQHIGKVVPTVGCFRSWAAHLGNTLNARSSVGRDRQAAGVASVTSLG